MTCGFKSHLPHQTKAPNLGSGLFFLDLTGLPVIDIINIEKALRQAVGPIKISF